MGFNSGSKTLGGGKAKGTADAFNQFLLGQLQNGTLSGMFGQNGQQGPGQTGSFDPLTYNQQNFDTNVDPTNPLFAALGQQLNRNTQMGVSDLRTRYGMGGAPRGSNAAVAEGNFLAGANPQNMLAMNALADQMRNQQRMDLGMGQMDNMQRMGMAQQGQQFGQGMDMQKLQMMMQAMMQANQIGTPQSQTVMTPSPFSQVMGGIAGLAPWAMAPFTGGASLGLPQWGSGGANTMRPSPPFNPSAPIQGY